MWSTYIWRQLGYHFSVPVSCSIKICIIWVTGLKPPISNSSPLPLLGLAWSCNVTIEYHSRYAGSHPGSRNSLKHSFQESPLLVPMTPLNKTGTCGGSVLSLGNNTAGFSKRAGHFHSFLPAFFASVTLGPALWFNSYSTSHFLMADQDKAGQGRINLIIYYAMFYKGNVNNSLQLLNGCLWLWQVVE